MRTVDNRHGKKGCVCKKRGVPVGFTAENGQVVQYFVHARALESPRCAAGAAAAKLGGGERDDVGVELDNKAAQYAAARLEFHIHVRTDWIVFRQRLQDISVGSFLELWVAPRLQVLFHLVLELPEGYGST